MGADRICHDSERLAGKPLSCAEVGFLWWFIQGSIMDREVREALCHVCRSAQCAVDEWLRCTSRATQAERDDGTHAHVGQWMFQRVHELLLVVPIAKRRGRLAATRAVRKLRSGGK